MADDCGFANLGCRVGNAVSSAIGDALTKTADAVLEAVGKALASLGTMWVNIGTPTLTGGSGSSTAAAGDHAASVDGINTILGWATWIAFGVCILSMIATGVRMGLGHRGESRQHVDRLGVALIATIIVSAAVGVVTAIVPAGSSNGSPTVAFIQNSLWWYMVAVAVLGVIVGAARMAWEQRADAGKDLVRSLMTLVVVSGAGLTAVSLLTAAGDSFSVWLLDGSLKCSVEAAGGGCFGANMTALLALSAAPGGGGGLGSILIIVLGLLAIVGSVVQILLMIVRAGMLVVLAGVLPVSAAATNTETGRTMFKKTVGWLLGFILYKPAAAIVYATAFKLSGANVFKDDGSGLINIIVGLTLMAVALVALPALMSLIMPAVSAVAGGSGMAAAALGGAAMLPTGAVQAGRLAGGGGGSGNGSAGASGSSGAGAPPSGSTNSAGLSGASGSSGSSGPIGPGGPAGTAGGGGTTGDAGGPGAAGLGSPGAPGAGAGAGAGAAGAGGSGAAAGAAAGPVGAAAAMSAQAATGTLRAGVGAVQSAAGQSAGESTGGPDGSR